MGLHGVKDGQIEEKEQDIVTIEVIPINTQIVKFSFDRHKQMKEIVMTEINKVKQDYLENDMDKDNARISYTDWGSGTDENRNWYNIFKKDLHTQFLKAANFLGFRNFIAREVWFQSYKKNDLHTWHIHSCNYTGVYYLNYDKNCKTELYDPIIKKKFSIDAKEGDMVFFPSFIIHRSPRKNNIKNKTIISWNIDFELVTTDMLKEVNGH